MLDVNNNELVVEEKGIYSIEKFLMARRLMYWQVYLHKNVICAGEMLGQIIRRAKFLFSEGKELPVTKTLRYFLCQQLGTSDLENRREEIIDNFYRLDDSDIIIAIKAFSTYDDYILSYLSRNSY